MDFRQCFFPSCTNNNSTSNPGKIFVRIPEKLRKKWCSDAGVEYYRDCVQFCCEDHFNPTEDLLNYYQHKLIKAEPKLKSTASLRTVVLPKTTENVIIIDTPELHKVLNQPAAPTPVKRTYEEAFNIPTTSSFSTLPMKIDVATQYTVQMVDKSTNYKVRKVGTDVSMEVQSSQEFSSTTTPSLIGWTSETEEVVQHESITKLQSREMMLKLVFNKSQMYLGLPKHFLWLIDYIVEKSNTKVDTLCLIVTLLKIRQNDSVERISDQFEISKQKLSTMILTGIEVLANYFQNFIFCPESSQIKQNLPLVFKVRYSNVQMIIDCFEIEITKPSNPLKQAQSWSQYKNCNTVKYLIGYTPNGFVSFVSKGFGGRISDKAIVEKSNLVSVLNPNSVILADRGFKEIESLLNSHGIKLLRPPSVYSGTKQTTTEALQSKVIASLRVHIERVIRRVREFAILKPHSVVNYKYVPYLDELVLIACGLINLKGEIIKSI